MALKRMGIVEDYEVTRSGCRCYKRYHLVLMNQCCFDAAGSVLLHAFDLCLSNSFEIHHLHQNFLNKMEWSISLYRSFPNEPSRCADLL